MRMKTILTRLTFALMLTSFLFSGFATAQELAGPSDAGKIFVKVKGNREISGIPAGLTEVKVTTSFGEVAVPLAKIDGIKMKIDNQGNSVIAFKNGDMITGKITLKTVNLKTDWGQANINTEMIEMISLDKNGRFYQESGAGSKGSWRFSKAPPVPAGQVPRVNRSLPAGR